MDKNYKEDKGLYWKKTNDEREKEKRINMNKKGKEVKDVGGRMLKDREGVRGRLVKYFEGECKE